uniref:Uncharacterized protein n=1 Tax=Podoviridae sp. ctiuS14 TaxID=2827620 RepID=A0A8S5LMF3_9CAUD|nr:MAG TPA: hypothetical protein [Podoviridae sp. ctiuS14]
MAIFDPQRQMAIPHFQTPQYYSDLDTLAKLQKLFDSQAEAKRQEELHPFELSKAEKMNTRLDIMNEAGRQDIDFDKELHPIEVLYRKAVADSAKAIADFDQRTLEPKIANQLGEYKHNVDKRPLELDKIKAEINSSNANAYASNASAKASNANTARLNWLLNQDQLAAKELAGFREYVKNVTGYTPEELNFNIAKEESERLKQRQQKEDTLLENSNLVFDPEQKKFVVVPNTSAQNSKDGITQAYLDAAAFSNKTNGATYKPWNVLSLQDQKTLEEAYQLFGNNPQKISAVMNGLQLTNGTTTLPKEAEEEAVKVAEELMAGRQQQSNLTDVAQLVSQSMKQGNADKLYDRATQGDPNAIAALQFMVENNPTATKAFYLNPKTKEMQELPQGYGNYINQNTNGGLAKSGVANGVYYQRPFESLEHVSKNIPGNVGIYKNTSGQVQDLPERGSDYSENVRLIQNVTKSLDKPIFHNGEKTKEMIAGKVGRFITDIKFSLPKKDQEAFDDALKDSKNGRYAQDMVGLLTYFINTRGDQGLNVKSSPTFAKAVLAFAQSRDSKEYQSILKSGDLEAFGEKAKEVAYILDDMRGAYEEVSRSRTSDGSLPTYYNILTTNKDSIRPTVNDEKINKEEKLDISLRYVDPTMAKEILKVMERKARERNANEEPRTYSWMLHLD